MKSERRHELQQNTLAKVITQAPGFWQQSGGRTLLVVIVAIVVFVLVRYRISSSRADAAQARSSLADARMIIEQLGQLSRRAQALPPGQAAVTRRQFYNDASNAITEASSRSSERQIAAETLLAKGDLNWAAAQFPELPGASTQPMMQFKDPKELLASALDSYQNVVTSYSDIKHAAIAARFGLAAIAENRGDFDAARKQYEAITAQASDVISYQKLAADRLRTLDDLKKPVIIAKPATEPVEPAAPTTAQAIPPLIAAPTTATSLPAKGQATTKPASQP